MFARFIASVVILLFISACSEYGFGKDPRYAWQYPQVELNQIFSNAASEQYLGETQDIDIQVRAIQDFYHFFLGGSSYTLPDYEQRFASESSNSLKLELQRSEPTDLYRAIQGLMKGTKREVEQTSIRQVIYLCDYRGRVVANGYLDEQGLGTIELNYDECLHSDDINTYTGTGVITYLSPYDVDANKNNYINYFDHLTVSNADRKYELTGFMETFSVINFETGIFYHLRGNLHIYSEEYGHMQDTLDWQLALTDGLVIKGEHVFAIEEQGQVSLIYNETEDFKNYQFITESKTAFLIEQYGQVSYLEDNNGDGQPDVGFEFSDFENFADLKIQPSDFTEADALAMPVDMSTIQ